MKKILLGCTALSVILIGAAIIGFQKKQMPAQPAVATQPAEPLNADAAQNKNTAPIKPDGENVVATSQNNPELQGLRFYSESEEQILEALENYIYFKNLNSTMRPDIKTDGRDFIITFSDPSNINAEQRDLKMTRIEDFVSKAQYRITTQSWVVWNEMVKQAFANADLSMDSFNEVVSWVPDLSLKTNDSIKATGIKLTSDDVNFTADSIVFDLLVGPHDNKMDIASSTDINNLTLTTPIATLSIPKMTENLQVIGSDITPNETLQILTAEQSQSTTTIPTLSVQSSMLGAQPLTAKMDSQVVFAETMKVDLDISDIRAGQILLPLMPNKVTAKFEVTGVDKDILTEYVKMQQAYNEMDDNDSDEAKKLEENLVAIQNKVLTNLGVNIEHITVSNENAGLDLSGVIHYAEPALTVSAKLAVTNFDLISPKAAPIDEEACKAALETQSVSQNTAGTLPPVCMQQAGALEFLRPYLETAQHTKDAAGRPVDTFIIVYSANSLTINGEPVLVPANEAADNNEAKNKMDKAELIENFSYLSDWEDKYRYLIELGEKLPALPDNEKTAENKVDGCMSQVWISHTSENGRHYFLLDSDAHIVRGLEAVLFILINGKTAEEIKEINIEETFNQLGLAEHLSPTRRNGFASMVNRIHNIID